MDYHKETAQLIERQCRNVERSEFRLNKKKAEELILKTYDIFGLPRPKKVIWCKDVFDKKFYESAGSAWSAGSARSAWSAGSARSAGSAWSAWSAGSAWWTALDYDFDWYVMEYEYCKNPDSDKLPNENDFKYLEYCGLLMQAKEAGAGYRVEFEDILYLVPTPLVRINSLNQWHSDTAPSIRWKGGKEFFYLNGVKFPKELWKKVVSKKMPFEEIMAIQDIDQRTQAMKYGDMYKFFESVNGNKIDTFSKYDINGEQIIYELWEIPSGDVFSKTVHFASYLCPSTRQQYISGVPEFKSVVEAMAWKSYLTPDQWKLLIPLESES